MKRLTEAPILEILGRSKQRDSLREVKTGKTKKPNQDSRMTGSKEGAGEGATEGVDLFCVRELPDITVYSPLSQYSEKEFLKRFQSEMHDRIQYWVDSIPEFDWMFVHGRNILAVLRSPEDHTPLLVISLNYSSIPSFDYWDEAKFIRRGNIKIPNRPNVLCLNPDGFFKRCWAPSRGLSLNFSCVFPRPPQAALRSKLSNSTQYPEDIDTIMNSYCRGEIQQWEEMSQKVPIYFGALTDS